MCGIAGLVSVRKGLTPPCLNTLNRMASALHHRGPDEFGCYRDRQAGLSHTRLSIIDLASGQQPLCNESGDLWVIFNGEIFNFIELRAELIALGHQFRTRSDTEVIVHAYEAWGDNAFERFNGQFAIALWDSRERMLTLVRDRLGVRPLYVCPHQGRLYFASEVKAIFAADPSIPRAFDPAGLDETFTFWTVVPPRSVFHGVEEVPPGHLRKISANDGLITETCYWKPRYPEYRGDGFSGSLSDATEAVREALLQATKLRSLRADVPVGCYLSGGLDSSLIAALGREISGDRFCTFSLRFEDAEYDETSYQRALVKQIGSDHREISVSRGDIAAVFPDVIAHTERPILRTAPAPLFLLSRLVHESGIKVVLTGEGADEMFAGYDLFREAKVRRFWARQPESKMRPRLLERLYPYLARSPVAQQAMARQFFGRNLERFQEPGFGHAPRWQTTAALKRLFSSDQRQAVEGSSDMQGAFLSALPPEFSRWSALAQDQYIEVRTLLSGYLLSSQGDRMLMANSVEGRFPFLDKEVVALANSLPDRYKLQGLDEKHVLKRIGKNLIPDEILRRPKQPYRAPDAVAFLASPSPDWVEGVMSREAITDAGVFDPTAVGQLWNKCRARREDSQFSNSDNMALVGILSTQLLHEQMVRRAPVSGPPVYMKTCVDKVMETPK